jgi:hypothetical protein
VILGRVLKALRLDAQPFWAGDHAQVDPMPAESLFEDGPNLFGDAPGELNQGQGSRKGMTGGSLAAAELVSRRAQMKSGRRPKAIGFELVPVHGLGLRCPVGVGIKERERRDERKAVPADGRERFPGDAGDFSLQLALGHDRCSS